MKSVRLLDGMGPPGATHEDIARFVSCNAGETRRETYDEPVPMKSGPSVVSRTIRWLWAVGTPIFDMVEPRYSRRYLKRRQHDVFNSRSLKDIVNSRS